MTTKQPAAAPQNPSIIVYDGECPFCSRYVALLKLKEAVGPVRLVNARDGGPIVDRLKALGYDLDEGMVLEMDGRIYHGADCIHRIALLSTGSSFFNRLNAAIFRSKTASAILYPVLRFGRNTTLALLGRRKLANHDTHVAAADGGQ